jgi:hypothetical protein
MIFSIIIGEPLQLPFFIRFLVLAGVAPAVKAVLTARGWKGTVPLTMIFGQRGLLYEDRGEFFCVKFA